MVFGLSNVDHNRLHEKQIFFQCLDNLFMTASILSSNDLCTEIVIKIEHDRSMADFEDKLQDSLNEAGRIGVQKELEWLDTDGSPIMLGDVRLTSKNKKELKIYESPWGAVKVKLDSVVFNPKNRSKYLDKM